MEETGAKVRFLDITYGKQQVKGKLSHVVQFDVYSIVCRKRDSNFSNT